MIYLKHSSYQKLCFSSIPPEASFLNSRMWVAEPV